MLHCAGVSQNPRRMVIFSKIQRGLDLPVTSFASLRTHEIESFEELNEIVLGTQRQIVQIEHGKIHGRLCHASPAFRLITPLSISESDRMAAPLGIDTELACCWRQATG
jgi:hypothetical protein